MNKRLALGDVYKKNIEEKDVSISENEIKSFAKTGSFKTKGESNEKPKATREKKPSKAGSENVEIRRKLTCMVSETVMNGLIDLTAKRRKERVKNRSQQDIVNELLEKGLSKEGFI